MIIHLDVDWDDAILERFALVVAQQSLHFALQLNWILQGALQDYQPEKEESSEPNPTYNAASYSRCLKLLRNVERVVVYGKPRAAALQKLYEQGKITEKELLVMEQADRRFNALQITAERESDAALEQPALDGNAEVALPMPFEETKEQYLSKFCSLDKHVLNVYSPDGACSATLKLDRAMNLERATVARNNCVLTIRTRTYKFLMRFGKVEEARLWARRIEEEADTTSLFQKSLRDKQVENMDSDELQGYNARKRGEAAIKEDLTPAQLDRYEFFQNERDFVQSLTDLAEELREHERDERKKLAPQKAAALEIPKAVYMPLCNSSNIWRRVAKSLPNNTRVFNTKERCPVILHFVTRRGETYKGSRTDPNLDIAEYMHSYFEVDSPGGMENVPEEDEETEKDDDDVPERLSELQTSDHGKRPNVWQEEHDHEPPTPQKGASDSPQKASKGNRRVQRLLRESVVLPTKLAKRLKNKNNNEKKIEKKSDHSKKGKQKSIMDMQTEMQDTFPILDGNHRDDADNASVGDGSVVSIERSSVLINDQIVFGNLDEGNIDIDSIDRAKKFVCGGHSWAEKSADMLAEAKEHWSEADKAVDDSIQLEVQSCMSKSNDDLRQEVFVMQMIHYYKSLFASANIPVWLKTYRILSTGSSTGLLEVLTDATSLDGLKKSDGYPVEGGLRKYFEIAYGGPDSDSFKEAQTNFMQSLAGYAIVSYLLGLKDRHNGNIMIDTRGHLIFIDFGFAMGMAPGHEFSFERAPFKLTKEYVELMDGVGSKCYKEFENLFVTGMMEARKNSQIALGLVEIMMYKSNYPCFSGRRYGQGKALVGFEKRLMLHVPEAQAKRKALQLVRRSRQHFGTYLYDAFQKATNGYAI